MIAEPVRRVQFIGFVKFASTYFHQIEREVLLLLGNNSLGKATTENQADEISTVRVLQPFVIHSHFTTLLSFYIKKWTRFQQIRSV